MGRFLFLTYGFSGANNVFYCFLAYQTNHFSGAFMICTLPSSLLGMAFWFGKEYDVDRRFMIVTGWVLYLNSVVNPIIYGVFNPEFR